MYFLGPFAFVSCKELHNVYSQADSPLFDSNYSRNSVVQLARALFVPNYVRNSATWLARAKVKASLHITGFGAETQAEAE
jgi:hypothetical protein